jgi:hypothetical protein
MIKFLKLAAIALSSIMFMGTSHAILYNYSSTVTLCTGTCASFASLDVGSTINGVLDINTAANSSFADTDIVSFVFSITNPALPVSGPVGDPLNDNPLIVDSILGIAGSTGTSGTTNNSNDINGGQMLIEFLIPPFSSNGAFVVFDLATGNGQVCLFYATAGCIPGATQAVVFEGSFSLASVSPPNPPSQPPAIPEPLTILLFGIGLVGMGLTRRKNT